MGGADEGVLGEGKFLRFVKRGGWEFVERRNVGGIVVMAAETAGGCVLFVTQRREPAGGEVVELPAGLAGDEESVAGEGLEEAARRELLEETGFGGGSAEEWMTGPPSAGVSSEIVTFFVMRGVWRTGRGGGVGGENIRVHAIPKARAAEWLEGMRRRGVWVDPKVYAGLWVLGCTPGGPGFVRSGAGGRDGDAADTCLVRGRDGARPSQLRGEGDGGKQKNGIGGAEGSADGSRA